MLENQKMKPDNAVCGRFYLRRSKYALLGVLLGGVAMWWFMVPEETVPAEEPRWCYYKAFATLEEWESYESPPPHVYITSDYYQITIHVPCSRS